MARCAMDGTHLARLMQLAIPVCQAAQRQCPRTGPGRPPKYDDWKLAVIIKLENLVQQHRQKRISFYLSPPGQQLYARRSQTVEPFNDWFKSLFELVSSYKHPCL